MENEYKIINIVDKYQKHFDNKNDFFALLLDLKQNVEFNSNFKYAQLYEDISLLYKDPKPGYQSHIYTPDPINKKDMGENDIFIFGSNTEGIHGAGAAKVAVNDYGAIYGQAKGLQRNSYAIVTKDLKKGNRSIDIEYIQEQINDLFIFCVENTDKTFWMTKIGCGLGGFEISDIAPLFANKIIPKNLILPKEFTLPQYWADYLYLKDKNLFFKIDRINNTIVELDTNNLNINTIKTNLNEGNIFKHIPYDVVTCDVDNYNIAFEYILKKIV